MKSYESHADHLKERVSSLERKLEESAEEKQRIMSNLKRKEAEEAITSDEIVADLKSQMHKEQLKLSRVGHVICRSRYLESSLAVLKKRLCGRQKNSLPNDYISSIFWAAGKGNGGAIGIL